MAVLKHSTTKGGFVLLEVVVCLIILSVAISAFLRSFSVSIKTIRNAEIVTQASVLAQQLMDEFEIVPPLEALTENEFGEEHPNFYYVVESEILEPDYEGLALEEDIEEFQTLQQVSISIYYDDGQTRKFRPIKLTCYLTGLEKFSYACKRENQLY